MRQNGAVFDRVNTMGGFTMRWMRTIIGYGCVLSVVGCQMLRHPVTETNVDQELTTQPAPTTPPPEVSHEEPRAGFEQEPPKSQQP